MEEDQRTIEVPRPPMASGASRTLTKSVVVLAIEPINLALTVTGRKAYNVMLWIAQRSRRDAEGFYSSPVSEILRGYGSTTNASKRVQGYIEQMMATTIRWRPLAAGEETLLQRPAQSSMPLEGMEPEAASADDEEVRTFPLLAEVRIYRRGGQAWVNWFYPPTIQEQLLYPQRWAKLELESIAELSTYTAVALYEICARYKNVESHLTSRHPPEFWSAVLREGGGGKPREWRKFKHELLTPAIAEINEKTEITIELREQRALGGVTEVQFDVRPKAKAPAQPPEPVDVSVVMRAARSGVREDDIDTLLTRYGQAHVTEGLDALESQIAAGSSIHNPGAYLRRVLSNRFPEPGVPSAAAPSSAAPQPAPAVITPGDARRQRELQRQALTAERVKRVHSEFDALEPRERDRWIDETATKLLQRMPSPGVKKRLAERDWQSPLIRMEILNTYASARYGSRWMEADVEAKHGDVAAPSEAE